MPFKLKISGIVRESVVDGPGLRYVIFVQGCPHRCPGCHNPQTHDFAAGYFADQTQILREIKENPLLSGVTFSGGEPFCQAEALTGLAAEIRLLGKNLLIYSGYTIEQLLTISLTRPAVKTLLHDADFLIDGPYRNAERDLTLAFRGSSNQRFLNLRRILPNIAICS